jgi:predicted RNA-binding protein
MAVVVYNYIYQSHRDINNESVTYSVLVEDIYSEFIKNDSLANAKYLDKTVEVSGKITNIDLSNKVITVDGKLFASFKNKLKSDLKINQTIRIKGRLIGFDDLLEELKMDQCVLQD